MAKINFSFHTWFHSGRHKLIAFGVVFLLACIGMYVISHSNVTKKDKGKLKNAAVQAYQVTKKDMMRKISLSGQTVPLAQVDLSTKYAGRIASVNVDLGDTVSPKST